MKIEKIRTDSYSILKISKYDFLVKLIREIGNFPYVVSNIYEDNSTKTTIVEDQGMYINNGWNETDETALYISECNSDSEIRVYYGYEELFSYFLIYYFENILYLQNTTQQWVTDYLTNYIEDYVEKLKKEDTKKEVGMEVSSLCMMTFKKRTSKLLSLYKELYPYNRYEIKRILDYYILSKLDKEIIDLIKELSEKYEGEFLQEEFLISLIKDKPETAYKNFSKYLGVGKSQKEIKDLFSNFFSETHSKTKELAKEQDDFRTIFNVILRIEYKEESKEYVLCWQDIDDYGLMEVKLNGFDKKWYEIIFEMDNDNYEKWNYYGSCNNGIKNLYNPDIEGMKEKYGKFYYNIILYRIPYNEDIEFLNKLGWTNYKDFLKGKLDIEKNPSAFANRVRYVGYVLQDTLMSESDLIEQLEEIMAINKKNLKVPINLCDRWLERLKSGVKVKEL